MRIACRAAVSRELSPRFLVAFVRSRKSMVRGCRRAWRLCRLAGFFGRRPDMGCLHIRCRHGLCGGIVHLSVGAGVSAL